MKASKRRHALARNAKDMDINNRRMLTKAFFRSFLTALQYGCPVVEKWNIV